MAAHPAPVSFLRRGGKALKAVSDPQRGPTKFFSQVKKTLWLPNLPQSLFPGGKNFVNFQKFTMFVSPGKKLCGFLKIHKVLFTWEKNFVDFLKKSTKCLSPGKKTLWQVSKPTKCFSPGKKTLWAHVAGRRLLRTPYRRLPGSSRARDGLPAKLTWKLLTTRSDACRQPFGRVSEHKLEPFGRTAAERINLAITPPN